MFVPVVVPDADESKMASSNLSLAPGPLATVNVIARDVLPNPLVAFTNERLPMFPKVPTLKEIGGDFAYFMQRAVVGAPGMSADATAFYTDLFTKAFNSKDWQTYKSKKSLMGDFMAGDELKAYWKTQRDRHQAMLKASGAIK